MVFMDELAGGRGEQIMIVRVTWGSRGQQPGAAGLFCCRGNNLPTLALGLGQRLERSGSWDHKGGGGRTWKVRESQLDQRVIADRLSTEDDPALWLSTDHDLITPTRTQAHIPPRYTLEVFFKKLKSMGQMDEACNSQQRNRERNAQMAHICIVRDRRKLHVYILSLKVHLWT